MASAPLPKKTNGVDADAFDQSLPFHSQVTALGEIAVMQEGDTFAPARGVGAIAGRGCTGGTTGVVTPEEPDDADPEPPEQAMGPVDPVKCRRPTRSTSWLTGS